MSRDKEPKKRAGELKREEGGLEAERAARRDVPPKGARQHRGPQDEQGYPETSDEPAVRGEQDRAAERVAERGPPRPGDLDEPPHR